MPREKELALVLLLAQALGVSPHPEQNRIICQSQSLSLVNRNDGEGSDELPGVPLEEDHTL